LIGATTLIGHSQKTASEYASPSEAVPRGKAPKMQVQLLNPGENLMIPPAGSRNRVAEANRIAHKGGFKPQQIVD
jgi:hypothetical protein